MNEKEEQSAEDQESDDATPAPLFEEKKPEEPKVQDTEEELPQPIRGGLLRSHVSEAPRVSALPFEIAA